jgi:hypothetical protein
VGKWAEVAQSLVAQGFRVATFVFKSGQMARKSGQNGHFSAHSFSQNSKNPNIFDQNPLFPNHI